VPLCLAKENILKVVTEKYTLPIKENNKIEFLIRNPGGQKGVARNFSSAERKVLSVKNSILNKSIYHK
jgi:hypothetical protein